MIKKNKDKESDSEDSDDSFSGTIVKKKPTENTKTENEDDDVSTLTNFYKNLSGNDIKKQLDSLENDMQLEIQEIKNTYNKRRTALENVLKLKK